MYFLKKFYWTFFKRKNFSQSNEEDFIKEYFKNKKGFYIDVGCHDPFRYSNTALLYKKGWSGINIDANEYSINRFKKFRKRDINIKGLVSNFKKKVKYYHFSDHALNGVVDDERLEVLKNNKYKILKIEHLETISLNEILKKTNILKNIDFLTIDVEGNEINVLKSIDLIKYNVRLIMVEQNNNSKLLEDYLLKFNYKLLKTIDRNLVFEKS